MMCCASPNVECSGLHKPLDAASVQVMAPYHPGGCHGHQCCCVSHILPLSWRTLLELYLPCEVHRSSLELMAAGIQRQCREDLNHSRHHSNRDDI